MFPSCKLIDKSSVHVSSFANIFSLLDQPRRVNFKTKGRILLILEHFVPLYDLQSDVELKDRIYQTVSSLFGFFRDAPSREVLSKVLMVYSQADPILKEVH